MNLPSPKNRPRTSGLVGLLPLCLPIVFLFFSERAVAQKDLYDSLNREFYGESGPVKSKKPTPASDPLQRLVEATKKSPRDAVVWRHLGEALFYRRRYEEARDSLIKCLMVDPGETRASLYLGRVYDRLGDTEQADISFDNYVRLSSSKSGRP